MLSPFRLLTPASAREAAEALRDLGEPAKIYAGGAELLLLLRHQILEADYLVDIKHIPGLDRLAWDGRAVHIGATVNHHRLETDPLVREHLPLFAYAESHIGNIRVRNQGTIGGNLCFADPHADVGTALLVYDTTVAVAGPEADREMPLDEFLVGVYETALAPEELLTGVQVLPLPPDWAHAYLRVEQYYRPTLNVAVAARLEHEHVLEARLAVGCVGPRALRLVELEAEIQGQPLPEVHRAIAGAKTYLADLLEPVDDLLGSAEYKLHITSVLLSRALVEASASRANGAS
jgi:carbon-monoxide dehydrogenase medium subunit